MEEQESLLEKGVLNKIEARLNNLETSVLPEPISPTKLILIIPISLRPLRQF